RHKAGAVWVGVAPRLSTIGLKAVGLAVGEGRVGEQRGGDWLKCQSDAELGHHVGLAREIHVHLHRGGAEHHVEAVFAALRHIALHNAVALLRHHWRLGQSPFWREADAEEADAEEAADFGRLGEVLADLLTGLVDGLERRARQLELTSGLKADGTAPRASLAPKRDEIALLGYRIRTRIHQPVEPRAHARAG